MSISVDEKQGMESCYCTFYFAKREQGGTQCEDQKVLPCIVIIFFPAILVFINCCMTVKAAVVVAVFCVN